MRNRTSFPRELFTWFLAQYVFGGTLALLAILGTVRLVIHRQIHAAKEISEVVQAYDDGLVFIALLSILLIVSLSLWTGYKMIVPLGRIINKAQAILKREYGTMRGEVDEGAPDGEWADLETTLNRIRSNMELQDKSITQERQENSAILSAIYDAVVAIDMESNITFYNSRFALQVGEKRMQPPFGRLSEHLRNSEVLDIFDKCLHDSTNNLENREIVYKEGTKYYSLSVAPFRSETEQIRGAVGVFHDITELKKTDQVRIDFVANVSHEIRTPLTSMKGYSQFLQGERGLSEEAKRYLTIIEKNTDRLINLVSDLLNLSALESGSSLEKTTIDLKEMTKTILHQLEQKHGEKNQIVHTQFETDFLWADPKRIEQVLYNFLENSSKYVQSGGEITVKWGKNGDVVTLSVSDNGPGIPIDQQGRIFERFFRLDSARSRDMGGTGLGLAIVKHIVQRHGGEIHVQTPSTGIGSEFICTFPQQS